MRSRSGTIRIVESEHQLDKLRAGEDPLVPDWDEIPGARGCPRSMWPVNVCTSGSHCR
jgi:hypothetical protein